MARKRLMLACCLAVVQAFALRNLVLIAQDFLVGDGSAERMLPRPRHGFERIPETPETQAYQAQGRLAIDFAQIYFPARHLDSLTANYAQGDLDPLGRPSRYAPALAVLCSITICRAEFGLASLVHILIQMGVFYGCLVISLRALGMTRQILRAVILANTLLLLTPAGLSWFERGQFSLYVAASYLLLVAGLLQGRLYLIVAAAALAFVKWTSLPYVAVVFGAFLMCRTEGQQRKRTILHAVAFAGTIAAFTLATPDASEEFLRGLIEQEGYAVPRGISLAKALPTPLVKAMPLVLIAMGNLHARVFRGRLEALVPALAGSLILLQTYPTVAYEYNAPAVLGHLSPMLYWTERSGRAMPRWVGRCFWSAYVLPLVGSYLDYLLPGRNWVAFVVYLGAAGVLLVCPLLVAWRWSGGGVASWLGSGGRREEDARQRCQVPDHVGDMVGEETEE